MRSYGHLVKMDEANKVKAVWKLEVDGKRPQGRPKKRWMDVI